MNLLWLGDPKSFDVTLVGGKAANLNRLACLYHRIPDGFCLPVTLMDHGRPLDLRDEIERTISDLMACHSLSDFMAAVRSSAVDEDGAIASFAGQVDRDIPDNRPESPVAHLQRRMTSTLFYK